AFYFSPSLRFWSSSQPHSSNAGWHQPGSISICCRGPLPADPPEQRLSFHVLAVSSKSPQQPPAHLFSLHPLRIASPWPKEDFSTPKIPRRHLRKRNRSPANSFGKVYFKAVSHWHGTRQRIFGHLFFITYTGTSQKEAIWHRQMTERPK